MGLIWHYISILLHYLGGKSNNLTHFMEVFEKAIVDNIGDSEKVACYLTGGSDTRAILAVLLHHEYNPTVITYPRGDDQRIAAKIAKKYNLKHVLEEIGSEDRSEISRAQQFLETHKKHSANYDVIFSGHCMDEIWGTFDFARKRLYNVALKKSIVPNLWSAMRINNNLVVPAIEPEVMKELFRVNDYYLREKRLQYEIIERYQPELLDIELSFLDNKMLRIKQMLIPLVRGTLRYG